MSYLVTGGSGCVGSYVIRDLLASGQQVVNYDLAPDDGIALQVIPPEDWAQVEQVRGDITDLAHLCRTIRAQGVKTIIHLASLQIPASNANPPKAVQVVLGGLVNVLEAARIFDLKSVVWASSVAVFGPPDEYGHRPVRNDDHHRPGSVYGACKSAGEFLLTYYREQYGVRGIGLRYTAIYGVGRDRGLSSFTTEMIRRAAAGEPYQVPFSDDLIDWQYVEDVSRLTVRAAEVGHTKTAIFNTQGDVRPVQSGVDYLRQMVPTARLELLPGKFGIAWEYDSTLLEKELGFRPEYSMERGIHKTLNLYLEQLGKAPVPLPAEGA